MVADIAFINQWKGVTDRDAARVMEALQIQVTRDFAARWGTGAKLTFVPRGQKPPPRTWWLPVLGKSGDDAILGFHDFTMPEPGDSPQPMGKIFAETTIEGGGHWSVSASHELLEMLVNPTTNRVVNVPIGHHVRQYAVEVGDPVEDDKYSYPIKISDGSEIYVSNFVTYHWFHQIEPGKPVAYDFARVLKRPFEIADGGYASVLDSNTSVGWHDISARTLDGAIDGVAHLTGAPTLVPYTARPHKGSRRERMRTPQEQLQPSEVKSWQ